MEPEVRAWTIKKGTKAPQAAGKIHSDFERGFIRAEIVSYDDLMACGTYNAAKEKGLVSSDQLLEAVLEPAAEVVRMIQTALEETPPELMADVAGEGILLAGGGAYLSGFDRLLHPLSQCFCSHRRFFPA